MKGKINEFRLNYTQRYASLETGNSEKNIRYCLMNRIHLELNLSMTIVTTVAIIKHFAFTQVAWPSFNVVKDGHNWNCILSNIMCSMFCHVVNMRKSASWNNDGVVFCEIDSDEEAEKPDKLKRGTYWMKDILTPSLRRPFKLAILFWTADQRTFEHAFRFLRVLPEAVSTRHSWLWQTLDDVYTRRCFSESEGTRFGAPGQKALPSVNEFTLLWIFA